ncbi:hypothetical protein N7492_003681 [Penicillium capsulatum]|uniref:Arylsulfotransferase n=1 Tax=Penicillium capsulatum TaxID=69766 RepID=A0A9W9INI5_9EURO|nr:hypothetical protein N7492_003681 [Penicillium capsulatum]KAJ6121738.1 hypothetical protein N7512_004203 [Penicillium capsulatum]
MLFGALALLFLQNVRAERHDSDLMSFVTLPDVRALKWNITHVDRERQAPGYWFVAPYGQIDPEVPTFKFQQYQVGPYIYDGDGMLIWAGSPQFDNRNSFDFRPNIDSNGETYLSFIQSWEDGQPYEKGSGVILDKNYQERKRVLPPGDVHDFNMHEFRLLGNGKTALSCLYRVAQISLADFGRPDERMDVMTGGFAEVNVETSEVLAQWSSLDNIQINESNILRPEDSAGGFDYVHANAVDKNEAGDYIISMRFTDTIYGISGEDGRILWRLGGTKSDFDQDFTFSRQHDCKFVSSDGKTHVISLMNNAADERGDVESVSSALIVEVDTVAMKARVLTRIPRPDGGLTKLRGGVQILPNGNIFVGWSQWGYHSEHAPNGDHLVSAWFPSERFSTYRSYKAEFVGRPTTPPDVVASVYGTSVIDIATVIHVSWNGATDVAGWRFYAQVYDGSSPVLIGETTKTDFETMYIADGYMDWITAEAVDRDGNSMGNSLVVRTQTPSNWQAAGFKGSDNPTPDDPSLVAAKPLKSSDGEGNNKSGGKADYDPSAYADAKEVAKAVYKAYDLLRGVGGVLMLLLTVGTVGGLGVFAYRLLNRRKLRSYEHVPTEEGEGVPIDEIPLRSERPE